MKRSTLLFISVILLCSCVDKRFAGIAKMEGLYSLEGNSSPDYKIYFSNDSAALFFNIPIVDNAVEDNRKFDLRLSVDLYKDFTKKYLLDSLSYKIIIPGGNDLYWEYLDGEVKLGSTVDLKKPLVARINCEQGEKVFPEQIIFIDSTANDPSNFLVLKEDKNVAYNSYLKKGVNYTLLTDESKGEDLVMHIFELVNDLPRKPFVSYVPPPFRGSPIDSSILSFENGGYSFTCPDSAIISIHGQSDQSLRTSLFTFDENYPAVNNTDVLIDALRYFATDEEMDELYDRENKKEAIDDFWLACSGSKERARILIKEYYGRVAFSNKYFTSHVQGWKSDRGLIYVMFGNPKIVYVGDRKEYWVYGEEGKVDNLTFQFVKVDSPFSSNDFRLIRDLQYKSPWYRVQQSWRQGRIYYKY